MYPISSILYSTTNGTSLDKLKVTWPDKLVALVKKFKYRRANVKATGSVNSMDVFSSSYSLSTKYQDHPFEILGIAIGLY
jgi:hypothetical protein